MPVSNDILANRVYLVRVDRYGDAGGPALAKALCLPARTWSNYESGVTIPASVLLDLIEATGVEPRWLLTGVGDRYRLDLDRNVQDDSGIRTSHVAEPSQDSNGDAAPDPLLGAL